MELHVRKAEPGDRDDLADISRNTWEGHDYLEGIMEGWLSDSGFLVGETGGRVIACGKITRMPGRVAWLEGLRVHPDFQGRGFGRVMSEKVLQEALLQMDRGLFSGIEFSTYINNVESRAMAEKQGFRITEMFHVIGFEDPCHPASAVSVKQTGLIPGDLSAYHEHAPCGWKYVHTEKADTVSWMETHADIWETSGGARFLTSKRGFEFSPLSSSIDEPGAFVDGVLSLAKTRGMDYVEMMVHDSHRRVLEAALASGFSYWEEPGQANLPVYRHFRN